MNIVECLEHERLFRPYFDRGPGEWESWRAWRVFAKAVFGLPLAADELEIFRRHTGRKRPRRDGYREIESICGRRSGKTTFASTLIVFLAAFVDHSKVLREGEHGLAMLLAPNKRQASILLEHVRSMMRRIPVLRKMIESEDAESITLTNRVRVEVVAGNPRTVRGFTCIGCVVDEACFFGAGEDSPYSLEELVKAIRPAMLTAPQSKLILISSPHAKRGLVWQLFKKHFGRESAVLVWRGTTTEMNHLVDPVEIEAARELDPVGAKSEYDAEFRDDVDSFVPRETVEACVRSGREILPPAPGTTYKAFTDPSGGSNDSFTMAIGHKENEVAIVDIVLEREAPFSPDSVTDEFSRMLAEYGVSEVVGDNYAGMWPKDAFLKNGIVYKRAAKARGELYLNVLPRLTARRVELPDNDKLVSQFANLERTAGRGRDVVDHGVGQHDDVANAVAGVVYELLGGSGGVLLTLIEWKNRIADRWKKTGKTYEEQIEEDEAVKKPAEPREVPLPVSSTCCPKCASPCVVIRGGLKHCNACGCEWWKANGHILGEEDPDRAGPTGGRAILPDQKSIRFPGGTIPRSR